VFVVALLPALHEIDNKFIATAVEVFVEKTKQYPVKELVERVAASLSSWQSLMRIKLPV
jgi:hypothetical protein